jgi:hypothetical protein
MIDVVRRLLTCGEQAGVFLGFMSDDALLARWADRLCRTGLTGTLQPCSPPTQHAHRQATAGRGQQATMQATRLAISCWLPANAILLQTSTRDIPWTRCARLKANRRTTQQMMVGAGR